MSKKRTERTLFKPVLKFMLPLLLVAASYSLGAYTEARTLREQTIELGTSGYNTRTAQWGLYDAGKICQDYVSSLHAEDAALIRAAQEDQDRAVDTVVQHEMSQPPKLPAGIFIKAQKAKGAR